MALRFSSASLIDCSLVRGETSMNHLRGLAVLAADFERRALAEVMHFPASFPDDSARSTASCVFNRHHKPASRCFK